MAELNAARLSACVLLCLAADHAVAAAAALDLDSSVGLGLPTGEQSHLTHSLQSIHLGECVNQRLLTEIDGHRPLLSTIKGGDCLALVANIVFVINFHN